MKEEEVLHSINQMFQLIFHQRNNNNLEELLEKYAFDIKLPKQVRDSITNEITWADSTHHGKYITNKNMSIKDQKEGWMLPKRKIKSLQDIINVWNTINLMTTERYYDSINVSRSDTIYRCENVYRSSDCSDSKNIIYCDSCAESEYLLACQRSGNCQFCIRTDDSKNCSNCYSVNYSNKVINSYFLQDCYDCYECMFCSHISSKKYCIANMQFTKEEYFEIKKDIANWIVNSK